jgi:hypothetical protein
MQSSILPTMVGRSGAPHSTLPAVTKNKTYVCTFLSFSISEVFTSSEVLQIACVTRVFFSIFIVYKDHFIIFFGNYFTSHTHSVTSKLC